MSSPRPTLPRPLGLAFVALLLVALIAIAVVPLGGPPAEPTAAPPPPPAGALPAATYATAAPLPTGAYPAPPAVVPAEAYPGAGVTAPPPPEKPTYAPPTLAPAATLTPTALALAPSGVRVLWAENYMQAATEMGSAVWSADPAGIGARQRVLEFARETIREGVLSPDGTRLALVTAEWKNARLWVADLSRGEVHELDRGALYHAGGPGGFSGLVWSPDGRRLAYLDEELVPDPQNAGNRLPAASVRVMDVAAGAGRTLTGPEIEADLSVLGWSAGGAEVYYATNPWRYPDRTVAACALWAVGRDGEGARQIVTLEDDAGWPVLAPGSSGFILWTNAGLARQPVDGSAARAIPMPEGYAPVLTWRDAYRGWMRSLVVVRPEAGAGAVQAGQIDPETGAFEPLGRLDGTGGPGGWEPAGLSPDGEWLAAYHSENGGGRPLYWVHMPSGAQVVVPGSAVFVAWTARSNGGTAVPGTVFPTDTPPPPPPP